VYTYFTLLIFLGAFFVVNLILAVINESFLKTNEKRKKAVVEEDEDDNEGEKLEDEDLELRRAMKKKKT
jgi:regulatory protein YycI of two-component signal transduction system YycFG